MDTKTIRWGILGCGKVAELKSGPGFQRADGSRLVVVMRRDAALAADYARRHDVPRWYDRADALIDDPEVDAVYIATPPGSHLEYALQVCAAGKPAYVEKPMARNHAECLAMVDAFERAGLPLFVAYYRRALPRFLKVKEIVDMGRIGQVTGVYYRYAGPCPVPHAPNAAAPPPTTNAAAPPPTTNAAAPPLPWRLVAEQSGGGLFLDLGCHTLDVLDFVLGPLAEVSGRAENLAGAYAVEDAVAMQFRTSSGALGVAAWNFASGVRADDIEITGTAGRIALSTFGDEPVRLETPAGVESFTLPNPPHIQQPLIQTIVDDLRGASRCASTGVSAARTALVMDAVLQDYYGGRQDAFWTRPESWPGRRRSRESRVESRQ